MEKVLDLDKIRIAIIGIGNCASSLIQGIYYYQDKKEEDAIGLMHWEIGGYLPSDLEVVAAFDIDQRKVGKDVNEAIFAPPNCTQVFCPELARSGVNVEMGCVLDGVAAHMAEYDDNHTFVVSDEAEKSKEEIVKILKEKNA